jgi:hypothetical protein
MMKRSPLSLKIIFLFWLPLASTWLMMALEGPFLAAVIARLPEAKYNLAAYGVAFSFALILEAPIIMIMSASTALVDNKYSFLKLRKFTFILNGGITLLMLVILIPQIFFFITITLINLPKPVAELTYYSTLILLPWPGAIGYRRFYQGILIRNNLTHRVAYGTVFRLFSMAITALILYKYSSFPGVIVGSFALTIGVLIEAIISRFMVQSILTEINRIEIDKSCLSYHSIFSFYYPLALTSTLALGVHPIVTFFVGQSRFALESLAILPVINSLVFIFRSIGLSYQEVGISLMGKNWDGYAKIKIFATILTFFVVASLSFIAFSPLATFWFHSISGLSMELTSFSYLPLQIMCIMPGLSVILSWQRAILVNARNTRPITWASSLEVLGIVLLLFLAINYFQLTGAVAASFALVVGRLIANIYLVQPILKTSR